MKIRTFPSSPLKTVKSAVLLLVASAGSLTAPAAQAEDNSAASAAALKVLIAPLAEVSPSNAVTPSLQESPASDGQTLRSVAGLKRTTTQVQRGEGLDAVIRRTLPGLPLKEDFLRHAFMRVNPHVYPTPKLRPLRPGTALQVPSMDELRQMFREQGPLASTWLHSPSESGGDPEAAQHSKTLDKRRWVRFP